MWYICIKNRTHPIDFFHVCLKEDSKFPIITSDYNLQVTNIGQPGLYVRFQGSQAYQDQHWR